MMKDNTLKLNGQLVLFQSMIILEKKSFFVMILILKVNQNIILMQMDVKFFNEQEIIDQHLITQLLNQSVEIIIRSIREYGLMKRIDNLQFLQVEINIEENFKRDFF
jgi:hypothetical protein